MRAAALAAALAFGASGEPTAVNGAAGRRLGERHANDKDGLYLLSTVEGDRAGTLGG